MEALVFAWLIMAAGFLIINAVFSYQTKYISEDLLATLKYQVYVIPFFFAANFLVGYGFKLGYKHMHNMTLVVSSSKFFDMLTLVIVSYFFFQEVPTIKTFIGLGIVVAGLVITKL